MEDCPLVYYFNFVFCLAGHSIITIVTYDELADKGMYLHPLWQAVKDTQCM